MSSEVKVHMNAPLQLSSSRLHVHNLNNCLRDQRTSMEV
jgi:hypothetical protein